MVEKVALFWHGVFATGYSKLAQGKVLMDQIEMFRRHGFGDLRTLLVELSRDPSMIIWLDNNDNHNGAINENYGRELLELFSMGVGNYTEDDVKEASRAFTGWTVGNTEYMKLKADNDSLWPYGRLNLHFEFRDYDHDEGEIILPRPHRELQRPGHRRHHLRPAGDRAVHRPPHVQLLRRRRAARAVMAVHAAPRP